jgi:hypothetical protein
VLPDYYLPRPPMPPAAALDDFERLYADQVAPGRGDLVAYPLAAPKWQFLCWLADAHDVVLHGSGRDDIDVFEPRLPDDTSEFGKQTAVFAASDGLWAMYFAILDRAKAWSLINACFTVASGIDGVAPDAVHYYFSVNADALVDRRGFRSGFVYVLPRATFARQSDDEHDGAVLVSRQWASPEPVRPLARVAVSPDDFPFLSEVRGHDYEAVAARAAADPDGFPWR